MDSVPTIVEAVLIFLVFLSVLTWGVGLSKYSRFYRSSRSDSRFLASFAQAMNTQDLHNIASINKGRLARMCEVGLAEMNSWLAMTSPASADEKHDMLIHVLKQQAQVEQTRMENGLAVLASVGSTAPFIGLFGTVWGIMNAMKAISASGSASLDVVAGPIGEALIATAVGIAAAVPAILAYNYFIRRVRLSSATMDNFATAFHLFALKTGAL